MRRRRAVRHLIDTVVHLAVIAAVAAVLAWAARRPAEPPTFTPGWDDPEHAPTCPVCSRPLRR